MKYVITDYKDVLSVIAQSNNIPVSAAKKIHTIFEGEYADAFLAYALLYQQALSDENYGLLFEYARDKLIEKCPHRLFNLMWFAPIYAHKALQIKTVKNLHLNWYHSLNPSNDVFGFRKLDALRIQYQSIFNKRSTFTNSFAKLTQKEQDTLLEFLDIPKSIWITLKLAQ